MKKLTIRHNLFILEYLKDFNATRAAEAAGLKVPPLNHKLVKEEIQKAIEGRKLRVQIDSDYVLYRLREIDQMDVIDILNDDGSVKPIRQWPSSWRTTLSGLDVHEMINGDVNTIIKKIKWPDKVKNLEMIGKHVDVQAFKDRVETRNINIDTPIPENCTPEEAAKAYQDLIKNL